MSLFRVLLVDDEQHLRDGLVKRIDWQGCGWTVAGCAENGQAGLELAERLRPDLVITDIKMPFMDGLTMCRHILEGQPDVKLIVLSGFDDFEYAKQAVSLGTVEYLLKPIAADELTLILQRVAERLQNELAERRSTARLQEHYLRSLPILRELLLVRLFAKRPSSLSQVKAECERLSLPLAADHYAALYLEASPRTDRASDELIPVSLRELCEGQLTAQGFGCACAVEGGRVLALALLPDENALSRLLSILESVCLLGERYYDLTVTVGVGLAVSSLQQVYRSAQGAKDALGYRALGDGSRVLYIGDLEPDPAARFAFDEAQLSALSHAIKSGGEGEIQKITEGLVRRLTEERVPQPLYRFYLMAILTELAKLSQVYQISPDALDAEVLLACTSPDALCRCLSEQCLALSCRIRRERKTAVQTIAEGAKDYIAAHFSDAELTAERVAEQLHVTPSYFSTVFKRETGQSFSAFLTRTRMERAAELLRTTDDKTYAIALQIGLSDPNYFSFVFKKHFGISPSKYREGGDGL